MADREQLVAFVMKFQQISGPVMAKGVEDTAFYVYNRLVSLNEVGGHPEHFGTSVADFHEQNIQRREHWPHAMLAISTHDTKRSEDVRTRINVLSELPDDWQAALTRWRKHNNGAKTLVNGTHAPDSNDEYLLYQTLLGTWPLAQTHTLHNQENTASLLQPDASTEFTHFRERIVAYMEKATKEAKVHTSWINPNDGYDAAMRAFIGRILDDTNRAFLDDLLTFLRPVACYGQINALAQTLLKLTSPGMPDLYQGTELWDFSLVDPDNRRPVDYQRRQLVLRELKAHILECGDDRTLLAQELCESSDDGRIKLYVIERTLTLRRDLDELFTHGTYLPLEAHGARPEHICAFARTHKDEAIITVVPRLVVGFTQGQARLPVGEDVWCDTWLTLLEGVVGGQYRNVFTEERLTVQERDGVPSLGVAQVCSHFPVALLKRM